MAATGGELYKSGSESEFIVIITPLGHLEGMSGYERMDEEHFTHSRRISINSSSTSSTTISSRRNQHSYRPSFVNPHWTETIQFTTFSPTSINAARRSRHVVESSQWTEVDESVQKRRLRKWKWNESRAIGGGSTRGATNGR